MMGGWRKLHDLYSLLSKIRIIEEDELPSGCITCDISSGAQLHRVS
jgi:hypothetical protein